MNSKYYQIKVKYQRSGEDGYFTNVTEPYIASAMTFTDAEAKITEELKPYVAKSGVFEVVGIRGINLYEVFHDNNSDKWYRVKIALIFYDEDTGIEKHQNVAILVCASDVEDAIARLKMEMGKTISDYEIIAVTETPIVDVIA